MNAPDYQQYCWQQCVHTLTDGMGVSPDMSTSSTPASNVPAVKFAASTNQLLIKFMVNSLHRRALTSVEVLA